MASYDQMGTQAYLQSQIDSVGRDAIVMRANGYFAETVSRKVIPGAAAAVDGTIYLTSVGLCAGELVSSISVNIGTAGTSFTLAKLGLYDKLGNRLAVSADLGTTWTAIGTFESAMITPYRISTNDVYYAAFIAKVSGSMPTVVSIAGASQSFTTVAGAFPLCAIMVTQTDLPVSVTFAVEPGTVLAKMLWMGLR